MTATNTAPRPTADTIQITWDTGTREVEVLQRAGCLAIHRTPNRVTEYTVSHVPSGTALGRFRTPWAAAEFLAIAAQVADQFPEFFGMQSHAAMLKQPRSPQLSLALRGLKLAVTDCEGWL
jgi:hypothetical protein